jgi:hypothetical protein
LFAEEEGRSAAEDNKHHAAKGFELLKGFKKFGPG